MIFPMNIRLEMGLKFFSVLESSFIPLRFGMMSATLAPSKSADSNDRLTKSTIVFFKLCIFSFIKAVGSMSAGEHLIPDSLSISSISSIVVGSNLSRLLKFLRVV